MLNVWMRYNKKEYIEINYGVPFHRWNDNIKTGLREFNYVDGKIILLILDGVQLRA
jgi:hypothetical protein